ncbi:MFS transporter [Geobacillus sp. 46C-IIa]|uniref:MFS transporter n=1 Tax=Geobacillus sp. 46C-IIa TaxID=1963025 RepID=UPI001CC1F130|nr:MFS transporter [Geobacillus sp. 46C-IIa]
MKRQLVVYFVSLAAFLGPFPQTIYTPILSEVRAAFATSSFLINLTISIFTFFLAMMQIIYGPLTDRKGRRTVLLFGLGVYVAASLGCFSRCPSPPFCCAARGKPSASQPGQSSPPPSSATYLAVDDVLFLACALFVTARIARTAKRPSSAAPS